MRTASGRAERIDTMAKIRDDEVAARLHEPPPLGEAVVEAHDVNGALAPDEIEAVLWERKLLHVPFLNLDAVLEPPTHDLLVQLGKEVRNQIHSGDVTVGVLSQHESLGTGTASQIKDGARFPAADPVPGPDPDAGAFCDAAAPY